VLPVPGQEFVDPLCRMILDASKDISEPGERVDVVELGGLCRPPNYAEWLLEQPAVCTHLRPAERMSPRFHSA